MIVKRVSVFFVLVLLAYMTTVSGLIAMNQGLKKAVGPKSGMSCKEYDAYSSTPQFLARFAREVKRLELTDEYNGEAPNRVVTVEVNQADGTKQKREVPIFIHWQGFEDAACYEAALLVGLQKKGFTEEVVYPVQ